MLERDVENALVQAARLAGGRAYKWVSPGNDGVPDRIALLPVPEHDRETVARYVRFVELKAPGQTPTKLQAKLHQVLRDLGYRADVIDNLVEAHAYFD